MISQKINQAKIFITSLFVATCLYTNSYTSSKSSSPLTSMQDAVVALENALDKADLYDGKTATSLKQQLSSKPASKFTEEELQVMIKTMLNYGSSVSQDARFMLNEVSQFLVKRLGAYKVSGVAFAFDPNVALIFDNQNPSFTVVFKNQDGQVKTREYNASINSVGLKAGLSLNFNLIFFTGDINFENSNQVLELETGIDLDLAFIPKLLGIGMVIPFAPFITYAPFKNAPGALCMIGLAVGFNASLSLVTGGTLTPKA